MDPHVDNTPGIGLPHPSPERGAVALGQPYEQHGGLEVPSVVAEQAPAAPQGVSPLSQVAPIAQTQTPPLAAPMAQTVSMPTAQIAADDNTDALDEEWINKAKAIIEHTKNDPYMESKELGKAKADYLQIRYNKQLKVAEDQQ